jgi:hypothetical protein
MGIEKFPYSNEIPWNKIKEIRVSTDGGAYSFEFEISGKKQLMTIMISGNETSFTLSKMDGTPIVHATQSGRDIKVVDFSRKLALKSANSRVGFNVSKKHN